MMRYNGKQLFMVCLFVFVIYTFIAPDVFAFRHVTVDASGVVAASKKINIDKIEALNMHFQRRKYAGVFSSAFHFMNFDFSESKSSAQSCFDEKDDGSVEYISVHLICGEMIARIYYMNAKYAEWADLMSHYMKDIVPEFWKRVPKTNGIPIDIMDMVDYSNFTDWPSVRIYSIPKSSHSINVKWERMDGARGEVSERSPVIKIKINGVSVEAMVDTGSSITSIPFDMARNLGIRHVSIVKGGAKAAYSEHMHAGLARVNSIDIAGFRFRNAMVSVSNVPRPVIGLVQLMKLHRILIGKNTFRVISRPDDEGLCKKHMYFGGHLTGPPSMIKMTAMIDGRIEHPILDTGFAGTFRENVHYMRNGLGEDFWSHGAVGNKKLVGYWTYKTINASGSEKRVRGSVVIYKKWQVGYRFGARLIKEIGPLYLDFDSGHACFLTE